MLNFPLRQGVERAYVATVMEVIMKAEGNFSSFIKGKSVCCTILKLAPRIRGIQSLHFSTLKSPSN